MQIVDRMKQFANTLTREGKSAGVHFLTTWTTVSPQHDIDLPQLTIEGYHKNSIASACIQMVATSMAEPELKIYRVTEKGKEEVRGHWLKQAFDRPSPTLSNYHLMEITGTFLNTAGNSYWLIQRVSDDPYAPVIGFQPLRADCVVPVCDHEGNLVYFHYQNGGEQKRYAPWQIFHEFFPDPLNPNIGLSPLARVMRELGIDNAATDFTKAFFENAAIPFGILKTDQKIREEEADRTQSRWLQWFKGTRGRNRFKPAVLGQGLDYQQIGLDFQQMEFETVRSFTETRICAAFGVDPVLLPSWVGIRHGGKYSNYREARVHLFKETIIPLLKRIASKLTVQFLSAEGLVAEFDLSSIEALQEDVSAKFTRVEGAFTAGIVKLNEARTELGYDPDPELGDRYTFQLQGGASKGQKSLNRTRHTLLPGTSASTSQYKSTPNLEKKRVSSEKYENPNKVDSTGQHSTGEHQ